MNALRVLREAAYFYSHNFLRIALLCLPLLLLERLSELALREQFGHWPRVCKNTFTSCMPQPTAPGRSDFPSICHDQRRWRVRALIKHCGTSWDSKNRGFYAVIAFNRPSVPMIFITRFKL